jgi:hypothetical protein
MAMVSDVLFDAVEGLRHYLKSPTYKDTYIGTTRKRIEALVTEMDALRTELDTPPKSK